MQWKNLVVVNFGKLKRILIHNYFLSRANSINVSEVSIHRLARRLSNNVIFV